MQQNGKHKASERKLYANKNTLFIQAGPWTELLIRIAMVKKLSRRLLLPVGKCGESEQTLTHV